MFWISSALEVSFIPAIGGLLFGNGTGRVVAAVGIAVALFSIFRSVWWMGIGFVPWTPLWFLMFGAVFGVSLLSFMLFVAIGIHLKNGSHVQAGSNP